VSSNPTDASAAEAQIGRPLRGAFRVVRRCHLALPVVLEVPPSLPGGEPFPTLYWLSCPLAHRRVARLEAAGGVREMDRRAAEEPELAAAIEAAHRRYSAARDALVDDATERAPRGGVGGSASGVKCLHAHLAHHLVDGANPVGQTIEGRVLPLDCEHPCVVADGPRAARNPDWREPRDQVDAGAPSGAR
jgi:hypothetical protein